MRVEARLKELGIKLPDYRKRPFVGASYGRMRPYRIVGDLLYLAGHVPDVDGDAYLPGILGKDLSTEQGYQAARLAGVNALAGMKQALGDLDRVAGIVRTLNYVVCAPDYHDVHKVANGVTDLFVEVFGEDVGAGARATLGIASLTKSYCFETVVDVLIR